MKKEHMKVRLNLGGKGMKSYSLSKSKCVSHQIARLLMMSFPVR